VLSSGESIVASWRRAADAKARLRCLQLPHFGHCREEHAVFQEGELLLARSRQSVSHSSLSRWTQTIYKVGT